MRTKVIGIDLSKKSTGVSVIEVVNNKLKVVDNYSIRPIKSNEFTKLHFYIKEVLISRLRELFSKQCDTFTVAFEFTVFSDYTSELQYYLTQEFLSLCYKYNLNVVGYSPAFLKKFVKLFVTDGRKYPSILDKPDIRDIYERYVYPLNEGFIPKSEDIQDDDSMDALFLGILGSVLQAPYLETSGLPCGVSINMKDILNHRFDHLLLTNSNYYKDKYLGTVNDFKFTNFRFNDVGVLFGKQFKELIKDSKNNNHLTLLSRMFFPFSITQELTRRMKSLRLRDPKEYYEFWTKYLGSRVSYLTKKYPLDKDFEVLFNKKGHYYLYTGE